MFDELLSGGVVYILREGGNFSYLRRRDGHLFLEGFMFDMILIVLFDSDYRVKRIQDG